MNFQSPGQSATLSMNRPLTPSLSPSDGERVAEGRVRGGSWSQCMRKSERGLSMNLTSVGTSRCDVLARESAGGIVAPLNAARTAQRAAPTRFRGSMREVLFRVGLSMNRPLTPSLSPSDGERVAEGRVRGGSWSQCMRKSERGLSMNLTSVGTSRCDVLARESAGGIVAPLNAARTAQRAAPTRFRGSMREVLFRVGLSMNRPLTPSLSPSDGERVAEGRVRGGSWSQCMRKSERGLSMNLTSVGTSRCDVLARESAGGIVAPLNAARTAQRAAPTRFRGSMREVLFRVGLSMNRPLTPSLSPSDGERVAEGRVRGGSWSQCMRKSERGLSMNLTSVGTSRCDVLARESAGGIVAPLNAARTAQRAVPTRFRGSMREIFRGNLSMNRAPLPALGHPLPALRGEGRERGANLVHGPNACEERKGLPMILPPHPVLLPQWGRR